MSRSSIGCIKSIKIPGKAFSPVFSLVLMPESKNINQGQEKPISGSGVHAIFVASFSAPGLVKGQEQSMATNHWASRVQNYYVSQTTNIHNAHGDFPVRPRTPADSLCSRISRAANDIPQSPNYSHLFISGLFFFYIDSFHKTNTGLS